jgi:hypothetical protein
MANEKFRVKYGLQVGDNTNPDAVLIEGDTGNIATDGDVNVKGGDIQNSTGELRLASGTDTNIVLNPGGTGDVFANADTLRVGDVAATAKISSNGAANLDITTNSGTASPKISITTGSNSNIQLAASGSGYVNVGNGSGAGKLSTEGANNLELSTNSGSNSGTITITQGANGDITIDPAGTGKVIIAGDLQVDGTTTTINSTTLDVDDINITLAKGAANAAAANGGGITLEGPTTAATITYASSDDSWNFNKKTAAPELQVDNINVNGNTIISTDTNGNITLDPNGTGDVALTLANGGNLTNTRNYVYGGIRNATTDSIGDIWALNSTGPITAVRGISLDNSVDTNKTAGLVLRQGSAVSTAPARLIFERSRGTVGSPTAIQAGDLIGIINGTGYTSTGWLNDNIAAVAPVTFSMTASENWVSNTNLGTGIALSLAPTATTITSTANLITAIVHNPQSATYRSDAFTFRQGKTGTTDLLTLGTTNSTLKAKNINLRDTSSDINNVLVTTGDPAGAGFNDRVAQIRQFSAITNTGEASTMTFQSARYNTGTSQYSPTLSGDEVGTFFFNGNYNTGATTAVNGPTARFGARATETWTSTANGGRFYVETINTGTITSSERMSLSNTEAKFRSDTITLEDSAGNDMLTISDASSQGTFTFSDPAGSNSQLLLELGANKSVYALYAASADGSLTPTVNFNGYRRSGGNNSPTQTNDRLGQFIFNGNTNTGTGGPSSPVVGGELRFFATENWTGSATGTGVGIEVTKQGTTTNTNVFLNDGLNTEIRGDQFSLFNMAGTALTSAAVNYTRTYGEFAYANAAGFAIAAQNTIYAMPLDTTLVSSGTSISNTSRINVTVAGFYKIFMSLQSTLTVSNQPAQFDFWLRKNGVDVANSKTQVDLLKDQKTVTSMHWLVESDGNDYWEIVYVGTTANYADIDFPTIAATTTPYVSPVAPALLVNVIPVGM